MNVALAQLTPTADRGQDGARVQETIAERPEADLIMFPELFIGGYPHGDLEPRALEAGGPELAAIGESCRAAGTAAVVGFTEAVGPGSFSNSAACFDTDGSLAGVYRKTHLFGPGEKAAYTPGTSMLSIRLDGRMVGPQICFDVEFPEPSRKLALAGAEVLVTIAANMKPYAADHRLAARARALDNRLPHLYVNRTGSESGFDFVGESCVIAPDGTVISELGQEEGILESSIPVPASHGDSQTEYLGQLRPDLHVIVQDQSNGGDR
ncbi:MAG: carbon-nitrogen hydrolase [Actinomycetota bacterium]|nr:carbon-nitrogen hydrolase [Actinomycetota bacterium]